MDDGLSDLMRMNSGCAGKALLTVLGGLESANHPSFEQITPGGTSQ